MAVRKIVLVPDTILTKTSKPGIIDESTKTLVQDLIDTLEAATHPQGAGIASVQIGELKRVCIVKKFSPDPDNPENELSTTFILINPEILTASEAKGLAWEGCLSIPDTYGQVERSKRVRVKSLDLNGNEFTLKAEGFLARVIQHEIDHLNGILFTSKIVGKTFTEKELDELEKTNND